MVKPQFLVISSLICAAMFLVGSVRGEEEDQSTTLFGGNSFCFR